MKSQIANTLLLLVVWGSVTGCVRAKGNEFPQIQDVFTTQPGFFEGGMSEALALSANGERLINAAFDELDLRTGRRRSVFTKQDGIRGLKWFAAGGGLMGWSVDGRYFAATQIVWNEDGTIKDRPLVIIDTQTRTARYYPGPFGSWSAVNSERLIGGGGILERESGRLLALPASLPDFRQVDVRGYGTVLWSVNQNWPVGTIIADPPYIGPEAEEVKKHPRHLYVADWESLQRVPFYQEGERERVVGWDFDPTGRFVLLMVWERSRVPEGRNSLDTQDVVDTKLVLVDWRTGAQRTLFRLSQLGDGRVAAVGWMSVWHWSADGSTIIVPRTDGSVVVLKVDYPGRHDLGR